MGTKTRRRVTWAAAAYRYNRARTDSTRDKALRDAVLLTAHGDKARFAEAVQQSYSWLMQTLRRLRRCDGNLARKRLAGQRAKSVLALREQYIRTDDGPSACSGRRIARTMKALKHKHQVSARSAELYVKSALAAETCSKRPDLVSHDNDPSYCRLW